MNFVWVALGGALGSVARYQVALWAAPWSKQVPWGTICINVAGSFIIGLVATLTLSAPEPLAPGLSASGLSASGRPSPEWVRLLVITGICGGFTTFSSFSLQTLDLLRAGAWGAALWNVGLSVALCLLAVWVGHLVAVRL